MALHAGGAPLFGAAATTTAIRPRGRCRNLAGEVLADAAGRVAPRLRFRTSTHTGPDADPMTSLHAAALTNGDHAAARISV